MSFFLGALAGLLGMWLLYTGKRRHIKLIEDEKQLLQQEKQIVVEFMHNMVEAVAEGSDLQFYTNSAPARQNTTETQDLSIAFS